MFILSINVSKKKKKDFFFSAVAIILIVAFSAFLSFALRHLSIRGDYLETDASVLERIIILDPGHGGEDCGAIGVSGIYEKDLNLQMARCVGELLEKEGYLVVYTRQEDKLLYGEDENIKGIRKISDLKNRCKIAEAYPDAIFVSLHMNSFGNSKYSGLQVYYSENDGRSTVLAESVQNKVRDLIQPDNNRKTKKGDGIYVLENISTPAILIECGFLSNPEECEKLSEKEYQNRLSFSIVCGIIEYMEKQ